MQPSEIEKFSRMLGGVFEIYGRQAPSPEARAVWWKLLQPHALADVGRAFSEYTRTEPKFPPTPAQILEMLGENGGDGRPEADEAWAIALRAADEAVTVVWTAEIAAAFEAARPVLDAGDEVGARMAFKAAYARIVAEARASATPARWVASLGHDPAQRTDTLQLAVAQGLLPAPHVQALLPAPEVSRDDMSDAAAAENLARIRRMLAGAVTPGQRRQNAASEAVERERARLAALKAQSAAKAAQQQEVER